MRRTLGLYRYIESESFQPMIAVVERAEGVRVIARFNFGEVRRLTTEQIFDRATKMDRMSRTYTVPDDIIDRVRQRNGN